MYYRLLFLALVAAIFFNSTHSLIDGAMGLTLGLAILGLEPLLKKCPPKTLFVLSLSLFFGTLLGEALYRLIMIDNTTLHLTLLVVANYIALHVSLRSADEIAVILPYIQLKEAGQKKKDLLLDLSALADPRVIDLALSGILDGHILLPRFLIKELQIMGDEPKAKKCLEIIKRLESMSQLGLKIVENDFTEIKEIAGKMIKLARLLDANLLTADSSKIQQAEIQGIRFVNIHFLANALKPLNQSGEWLDIKVQRFGKEPTQGVGYLEDGTMVVVNGGGEYIGQTIRCQVLSVKHSGTGRLIFCNAPDEEGHLQDSLDRLENAPSHYFVTDYERHRV